MESVNGAPDTGVLLKNPINMSEFWIWGSISLLIFLVGNIWIYAEGGFDWFGIIVGGFIAILIMIAVPINIEIIKRPFAVQIKDDGVLFYQRMWRKTIFITWSQIKKINIACIEPSQRNWNTLDGGLFINEKKYYILNWMICMELRERYRAKFGIFPRNQSDKPY